MAVLKDILNEIGDFKMKIEGEEHSFPGVLRQEENDVILKCKLADSCYCKISRYDSHLIYGEVNGIEVTLLNVYFRRVNWYFENPNVTIVFDPSEIIVGKCCTTEPQVVGITISNPDFNELLLPSPLQPNNSFSQESRSLLEYADSPSIVANDKYGRLSIKKIYSSGSWSNSSINYEITTAIAYKFKTPVRLLEAVSRIAIARALLTFFANHYLSFGTISFVDYDEEGVPQFPPNRVYLNHEDVLPAPKHPFLIAGDKITTGFESIWSKWLSIYDEAKPVVNLFYEIICNRSTRINRFLNLSQAIEVYSCRYREKMAQKIANIRQHTKDGKNARIHLNHRFEDILSMVAIPLEIDQDIVFALSKSFSSMRNYFTHYDAEKYMEPSYQEMLAGCHILELVLLAIVYREIGISDDHIRDCKKRAEFQRVDEFINVLNKDFVKSENKL